MIRFYFSFLMVFIVFQSFAQKYKVAGIIKDEDGKGIADVSVQELGTNTKASTNVNGIYEMRVHYGNATLVVIGEGFEPVEREIKGIGTQNFTLTSLKKSRQKGVVGSRNLAKTAKDLSSPVDIIDVKKIASLNGQFDLSQLLQYASASFNANPQLGADGTDQIDATSLHGMGPDQMLILVNGKRRHQSSLINLSGTRGRGNTSPDLSTIPVAAIDRIEILRDGAVAQYGSDAVAGVINIILKDNVNGFTANANAGIRKAKYNLDSSSFDGLSYNGNLNYGRTIAKNGFLNVTADYNFQDHTNRADARPDSLLRRKFGDPKIYNGSLSYNMAFPLYKKYEVYSFGTASYRQGETYGWTRGAKDSANFVKRYPKGYDPLVSRSIDDRSITLGIRTVWKKFNFDLSHTYGFNKFNYHVKNSMNKSFGLDTPTSFDAGALQTVQNTTNLDLTRFYDHILDGVHLAFGAEYRMDGYKIIGGNPLSWRTYNPLKVGGAQGFRGYGEAEEISKKRNNAAGYLDLEAKVDDRFSVNAAGRFDYYSDLGSAVSGKGGLRFELTDMITLRGNYGIGFRAPSLAQQHFSYSIIKPTKANLEIPMQSVIARTGSDVAAALGIHALKMEKTQNASAGIVFSPDKNFSVAVDGYFVQVKDRIILTGAFPSTDKQVGSLLKKLNVDNARAFANTLSTSTAGVDVTLKYTTDLADGQFNTYLSANYNTMRIDSIKTNDRLVGKGAVFLDKRERYFILASAPPTKINLMFDYNTGPLTLMVRGTHFGEIKLVNRNYGLKDKTGKDLTEKDYLDVYKAMIQADASLRYQLNEQLSFTLGGSNLLNAYPTMSKPNRTESGGAWDSVQTGHNGSFFYTRIYFNF
ncbi:TonB-dependent receptor [Dyadobacter sp. LHD-138]|uniref:TonB-dependent receptor n=1 Tax=Dyadobacter sp. LHD-138 TaxID=3071413 RepID=UPI0027DF34C3|nr:TonB-dependent receptor [Dyadobacter sp. LHD-138]MDQ6476760.1 TonB-dependent receptor [Dyadobacter sp. LHD-138]